MNRLLRKRIELCGLLITVIAAVWLIIHAFKADEKLDNTVVANSRNQVVEPTNVEPSPDTLTNEEVKVILGLTGIDEDGGILSTSSGRRNRRLGPSRRTSELGGRGANNQPREPAASVEDLPRSYHLAAASITERF